MEVSPDLPDDQSTPPPLPALPAPESRRHDLDALRAVAMFLGIVLHGALSFSPGLWMVQDTQQHKGFEIFIAAVHGFRMPLFFLLSGFFTAMLWRKRGLKALIAHRFKRIFLPMLIGVFTICPLVLVAVGWAASSAKPKPAKESKAGQEIWSAARHGDLDFIKNYAREGGDLEAADPFYGTKPLPIAALYGRPEAVALLLELGADVNAANKDGGTALHAAAFLGRAEIVETLLEAGADQSLKNERGETAHAGLDAPWGITKMIAGMIEVEVNKKAVMSGRRRCAELMDRQPPNPNEELGGLMFLLFMIPIFHHLWFLWFLCWLVAGFAIYALVGNAAGWKRAPHSLVASPARFLWLIPLTMIPQWFMGRMYPVFGADTSIGLLPMPHVLLYYAIFFGFGALYFDCKDTNGRLGKWWRPSIVVSLCVLFPLGFDLTQGGLGLAKELKLNGESRHALAVFLQAAYAWLMCCAFIGLFRQLLPAENRRIRYLSDSAYWLYIAHVPLIIAAQAVVRDWPLPALVKCAIVCLSVTGFLLLSYEYLVRYTWIGRLLNGPRTRGDSDEPPPSDIYETPPFATSGKG